MRVCSCCCSCCCCWWWWSEREYRQKWTLYSVLMVARCCCSWAIFFYSTVHLYHHGHHGTGHGWGWICDYWAVSSNLVREKFYCLFPWCPIEITFILQGEKRRSWDVGFRLKNDPLTCGVSPTSRKCQLRVEMIMRSSFSAFQKCYHNL